MHAKRGTPILLSVLDSEVKYEVSLDGSTAIGPVTFEELQRGIQTAVVPPHAKVRALGTTRWASIPEVLTMREDRHASNVVGAAPRVLGEFEAGAKPAAGGRPAPKHAPATGAPPRSALPSLAEDCDEPTELVEVPVMLARIRLGSVLCGKWRLDDVLGVGGMATVFAATHRNGSRAAVKIVHNALAAEPTSALAASSAKDSPRTRSGTTGRSR